MTAACTFIPRNISETGERRGESRVVRATLLTGVNANVENDTRYGRAKGYKFKRNHDTKHKESKINGSITVDTISQGPVLRKDEMAPLATC